MPAKMKIANQYPVHQNLQNKHFTPFPKEEFPKRIPKKKANTHAISTACLCGLSDIYDNMIQCDNCSTWYHMSCAKVDAKKTRRTRAWKCKDCV